MKRFIEVLPAGVRLSAEDGDNLYAVLRRAGLAPEAYCGGEGRCGKCAVTVNGEERLSCRTVVTGDMTVTVPERAHVRVLTGGGASSGADAVFAAVDVGTTTVVCSLLNARGEEFTSLGELNPQVSYGADVVSRIRSAEAGTLAEQTRLIRGCVGNLIERACERLGSFPKRLQKVCIVGNPAMHQLFMGLSVENLIRIPFTPKLTHTETVACAPFLPPCENAELLCVPDISGYVGADTVACVAATGMLDSDALTLLVDIGTNGEMVLGDRDRLVACATAAGPALEGAGISCGMRGARGAIDHVTYDGGLRCHVLGDTDAVGICGSGLIDAAAVLLDRGLLDRRGKLPTERIELRDGVFLTQEDVRSLQSAKGAICAGVECLCERLGVQTADIERVLLAGAFGTYMDAKNACRIGLLPRELADRARSVGNAACQGARLFVSKEESSSLCDRIVSKTELVELGTEKRFQRLFAKNMYF